MLSKYSDELKKSIKFDQEQEILIESLKIFAQNKDLKKSEIVNVKFLKIALKYFLNLFF